MTVRFVCIFLIAVVAAGCGLVGTATAADPARPATAAATITFSRDVWPIFRKNCFSCHSGEKPEGGLRLDTETHIRTGGDSGPLYDLEKTETSVLLEQVSGEKPAMPPK